MDQHELSEGLLILIEGALKVMSSNKLPNIDHKATEIAIERFLSEEADRCNPQEFIEKFRTPETSLQNFVKYMESHGIIC